jgi:hypothetical protein
METIKRLLRLLDAFGAWLNKKFGPVEPESDQDWIDRQW